MASNQVSNACTPCSSRWLTWKTASVRLDETFTAPVWQGQAKEIQVWCNPPPSYWTQANVDEAVIIRTIDLNDKEDESGFRSLIEFGYQLHTIETVREEESLVLPNEEIGQFLLYCRQPVFQYWLRRVLDIAAWYVDDGEDYM